MKQREHEMMLKKSWKNFMDKYMKNTAEQIDTSQFQPDEMRRYDIIFTGIVQGVGFRYEVWSIAQKLHLTGYVENLANGTVHAEIQGPKNRILHLIEGMKQIPRIHIEKVEIEELGLKEEDSFEIAN